MSELQPELIDVRPDERFDEAKVADYLRGRLEGVEGPLAVRQFGGGHANLTYLLRFGEGEDAVEYVLRRPPLGRSRSQGLVRRFSGGGVSRLTSGLWAL